MNTTVFFQMETLAILSWVLLCLTASVILYGVYAVRVAMDVIAGSVGEPSGTGQLAHLPWVFGAFGFMAIAITIGLTQI